MSVSSRSRNLLAVLLGCLVPAVLFGQAPKPGSGNFTVSTSNIRLIDGDTYDVLVNGQETAVGLIGVSAPMGNTFCGKAAQKLAQAILDAVPTVTLEEDPEISFDARSRRSYYVRIPGSNTTIQRLLVQAGVAKAVGQGKELGDLLGDQRTALRAPQGCLWGSEANTPEISPASIATAANANAVSAAAPSAGANVTSAAAPVPSSVVFSNGFVQDVVAGGFTNPTSFTPLPDGRILVTEKIGKLWVIENGSVVPTPVLDMRSQVNDYWDHGLITVVADPNFATNNYIYIGYTFENDASDYSGPKTARVSRLTMVGNTASLFSEVPILGTVVGSSCNNFAVGTDCIVSDGPTHSIDFMRFGPDGNLWITDGEGADFNTVNDNALRSQNLDFLAGKIYRITTAGKGLPDNPFYNGNVNANRSKVWAYGLRNPFRFNFRPGQNLPYIGDVGWSTWEEINVAPAGTNFGWPCYEGNGQNAPYGTYSQCQSLWGQGPAAVKSPLVTWNHNGLNAAAVGGAFYTGTSYPSAFQNAYFYGDYALGFIRYLTVDANNAITSGPTDFATNADGPIQIENMPDGNLYYLAINTGELRRIRYATSNSPPQAFASATPTNGLTPLSVQFSSAGSTDPNNQTLQYNWNFGDGTGQSNAANPQHTYTLAGFFTATLTVTNSLGKTATATVPIASGRRAPVVTINSPASSLLFKVGDVITYSGSATSPDTGPLPASSLSWLINLHHCPGGVCHTHAFTTATGAGGTFTVPDHGDQFYFELVLTATDTVGLTSKTSVSIQPLLAQYTLNTQPPGLPIIGGSLTQASPLVVTTVTGSNMQIYAPNQTVPGTNAIFSSWSDGGAQQHTVPVVGNSGNATATYSTTFNPVRVMAGNGGLAYFDAAGNKWLADTNYLTNNPFGGGYTFNTSAAIANTTIQYLYQSLRYQPDTLSYAFVLPNGSYAVTLRFAEIQPGTYSGPGQRVFNIGLNGTRVETGFDIIAAGGINTAVDKTYYLNVSTNALQIDLQSVVGNAAISAIQVLASPVGITPATASLNASQTRQFAATLPGGTTAANVIWLLNPATNSGTISTSGLYTAPATISATKQVTVTATNSVDATQTASAVITLNPGGGTTAPTVTTFTPVSGATGVAVGTTVTATFSKAMTASTVNATNVTLVPQGSATPVAATVAYNATSLVATLTPSAALAASTTYTATVKSGSSGVKDSTGTALAADVIWSFTTAGSVGTGFTPIRIRGGSGTPYTDSSGNVWAADAGYATNNAWGGGYTWATDAAIGNTTAQPLYQTQHYQPGTLQYQFAVPNGTYAVTLKFAEIFTAQYTQAGQRVFNIVLNGATVLSNFDVIAATGVNTAIDKTFTVTVTGGQLTIGLVTVNGNAFLNALQIVSSSTSAPTVASVTPTSGATGVATSSTASATFSKAMDATTITSSNITLLAQGTTTPIAATVSYNATTFVATLTPTVALAAGTVYTANIKSGAAGVKDSTGTPLAADYTWSFTTAAPVTFTPIRVRSGAGTPYTDPSGNVWAADTGYSTNNPWNGGYTWATNAPIGNTTTQPLYQTQHYQPGTFQYQFAVPNGTYAVTLKFAEIFTAQYTQAGQRVFNIVLNGATVLSNFDVIAATGTNTAIDKTYNVTVTNGQLTIGLVTVNGNAFLNALQIVSSSSSGPTVASVTPASGATGVATSSTATATFSKAMDSTTITSSNISLLAQGATTPIAATVSYNAAAFVATLTPSAALAAGTAYTATVKSGSAGVKDSAGNALAADFSWSFTTAGAAPTVTTFTPASGATGLATGTTVTATFSKAMTASTINATNVTLVPQSSTTPVAATVAYNATTFVATLTPSAALAASTTYTATVKSGSSGVKDSAGTALAADVSWSFSTVGAAPAVTTFTPVSGATGVAVGTTVTATFSKAMTASTVNATNVTLVPQGSATPVAATVAYNATSFVATLTPSAALAASTTYTATVKSGSSGVKDSTGTALAADVIWSFTTAGSVGTGFTPIRIRGGSGTPYTDPSGNVWAADAGYATNNPWSGGYTWATDAAIGNTTAQPLYQTQHYQPGTFQYQFAVPNGTYAVTLKFAEIFTAQYTQAGQRVFNIVLNGTTVLSNFDVIAAAGVNTAIDKTYTVTVTGGQLTIGLVTVNGNAFLNALQIVSSSTSAPAVASVTPTSGATGVATSSTASATFSKAMDATTITSSNITLLAQGTTTPIAATVSYNATTFVATLTPTVALAAGTVYTANIKSGAAGVKDSTGTPLAADYTWSFTTAAPVTFTPIRVRSGAGTPYTDPSGNVWAADTGYSTNNPWNGGYTWATNAAIGNTTTQPLYQTQHYQPGTFQYQFAVPNGTYAVTLKFAEIFTAQYTQAGQRVFNIVLNGATVLSNFDVIAATGTNTAIDKTYNVTVTNGQLTIGLVTVNGNAFLNALQIVAGP